MSRYCRTTRTPTSPLNPSFNVGTPGGAIHWPPSMRRLIWCTPGFSGTSSSHRSRPRRMRGIGAQSVKSPMISTVSTPPMRAVSRCNAVQRLTARIGGVETVEIMGDFTDWAPIPLIRRGRDLWELLVPLNPGVHQINLRIDGGQWIAPPGVPTLKDGFNGEVGVLVVRQ